LFRKDYVRLTTFVSYTRKFLKPQDMKNSLDIYDELFCL